MKRVKILIVASLLLVGLASCGGDEVGSVGDASVEFYTDNVEDGFGSGFVYVPIKLLGESVSADVKVTVEPLEYTGLYAGVTDVDYSITSNELVFKPGVDSVNMEIRILNDEVDEMRILLGISDSNAEIGVMDQAMVVLTKSTRDRMCGDWIWSVTSADDTSRDIPLTNEYTAAWMSNPAAKVVWDAATSAFNISNFEDWGSVTDLVAGYDAEREVIVWEPAYFTGYQVAQGQVLFQMTFVKDAMGNASIASTSNPVITTANADFTELSFPDNAGLAIVVVDANSGQIINIFTYRYWGIKLTKPAKSQVVPMSSAANQTQRVRYSSTSGRSVRLLDYQRINLEREVLDYLNENLN